MSISVYPEVNILEVNDLYYPSIAVGRMGGLTTFQVLLALMPGEKGRSESLETEKR